MSKEKIITAVTFIALIAAFVTGIFFIVRLVNGPGDKKEQAPFDYAQGKKTYTHPDYGFSFEYPADFTIGNFGEGDGETVLAQAADGKSGFQIFVSPYDEPEELSLAVIKKTAQDLKIKNEKEITVGRDALKAFSFTLEELVAEGDSGERATNEIWLVQNGNLFQFTSYEEFGGRMEEIIKSLRFN